jgi:hypothetical protein
MPIAQTVIDHPFVHCYERRLQLADEDGYRLGLAQRFSYVLPEQRLLEMVKGYSPLVELGAGTGYWAYLLRLMGADVIAYDTAPLGAARQNRYHPDVRPWTEVLQGDLPILSEHPARTLFLCWPPLFSTISDALHFYSGDIVLLIGDGGQRTSRLSALDRDFRLAERHPAVAMDPAAGTRVELSVWQRGHLPSDDVV